MLDQKISDLFHYRKLPTLLYSVESDKSIRLDFIGKLSKLQKAIYYLDDELEQSWQIKRECLAEKWRDIYQGLSELNIPKADHDLYCKHIYKYQRHEEELRSSKSIHRLSMEYFYFYKSCDVKLLRRIIYDRYPKLNSKFTLYDWKYFDFVTEVNDDIDDMYEDLETTNGNRFLISLKEKGVKETYDIFYAFLYQIKDGVKARFEYDASKREMISWTIEQVEDTFILLKDRCEGWKELQTEEESIITSNS